MRHRYTAPRVEYPDTSSTLTISFKNGDTFVAFLEVSPNIAGHLAKTAKETGFLTVRTRDGSYSYAVETIDSFTLVEEK